MVTGHGKRSRGPRRAGPGRPKGRGKIVTDEIVELAAELLAKRKLKSQIKDEVLATLGLDNIGTATFETIMSRARARLKLALEKTNDDSKLQALSFYQEIADNPKVDPRDRLKAQERIDRILGHEFGYSGRASNPDDDAAQMRKQLAAMENTVPDEDEGVDQE